MLMSRINAAYGRVATVLAEDGRRSGQCCTFPVRRIWGTGMLRAISWSCCVWKGDGSHEVLLNSAFAEQIHEHTTWVSKLYALNDARETTKVAMHTERFLTDEKSYCKTLSISGA
ncbi:hypothetical protein MRB53_039757 [Persea americana]|nr:hypothetical protein MRB53_039757 [Persea americana]